MKHELILLRHAHAENAEAGQTDADRPLSERGIAEAKDAAAWLKTQTVKGARVLCSPSLRTRQTVQYALGDDIEIKIEPRIYEATAGELDAIIDENADAQQLLLVGHNPGFETLVALLATGQSGDFRGMPPAGIAWFELDGAAEPASGRLKAFWSP